MDEGLCHCGCGERTPLATRTRKGNRKGQPIKYLRGHQSRDPSHPFQLMRKPYPGFELEDRGHHTHCWIWNGRKHPQGYAQYTIRGKNCRVHRVYYEKMRRALNPELVLDHLCGEKACVNPWHLEEVTQTENVRRQPNVKLTKAQAQEIYDLDANTSMTRRQIGRLYGVTWLTVRSIANGTNWKDIKHDR